MIGKLPFLKLWQLEAVRWVGRWRGVGKNFSLMKWRNDYVTLITADRSEILSVFIRSKEFFQIICSLLRLLSGGVPAVRTTNSYLNNFQDETPS